MWETLLLTITEWITSGTPVAALGCFLWGTVSVVLSPCHIASIPLIVAYVGGQEAAVRPRQAGWYAVAFTLGLFLTIFAVGVLCSLLGRMLGDVGTGWQIVVGVILVWVALGMLGVPVCSTSGSLFYRLKFRGIHGAFGLGLAYGILSGSCTFGFIAPILAIVTVQQEIMAGLMLLLLFALGHCLPIAIAGSSAAMARKLTENQAWQNAGRWFQRGAAVVVALLGVYFICNPLIHGI